MTHTVQNARRQPLVIFSSLAANPPLAGVIAGDAGSG
jgi:hypothetical protein